MYVRASHRPLQHSDVTEVMRQNMFATLVTDSRAGLIASHLPFIFDENAGERGTLYAHMARANPQSDSIADGEALILFTGPHAYISPSWYTDRATAPTWDYVAVHCYGAPRIHSGQEAVRNIARLVELVEGGRPQPWSMEELSEDERQRLLRNIVSFEIPLTRIEGKFKLNQGETPERTAAVVAELERHGDGALAALIRRYNRLEEPAAAESRPPRT